jgi:hypothetical protein
MSRKKAGVLIGFILGFLSQASVAYAQYMEMMGEYLNPIARWLVRDNIPYIDQEMLWLYVLSYIVVVSILIYAGLKKNRLFANQHGLAKNLAVFLTLMLLTAGSTTTIGIFGLAQGMMPIFVMFLIIGLLSKVMPARAGGPSIARGFGGGGWFSRGPSISRGFGGGTGWFSKGVSSIAKGYREIRDAVKREEYAAKETTEEISIEGMIGRANSMVDEIASVDKTLDETEIGLEEYQQKLGSYEQKYVNELMFLEGELLGLRWQNPNDPKIPELEQSIAQMKQAQEALFARLREAIERQKGALEKEVAEEEQAIQTEVQEEKIDLKALQDEREALRQDLIAGKERTDDGRKIVVVMEKLRVQIEKLTQKDEALAAAAAATEEEAEKEEKSAEQILNERLAAIDRIEATTNEFVEKNVAMGSGYGTKLRGELNNDLQILFPQRNNPELNDLEHMKKLHKKFEGLERTKEGVDKYKRRVTTQLKKIEGEEVSKEGGKILPGPGSEQRLAS